jgi:SIT4-associating protein SAP185/190
MAWFIQTIPNVVERLVNRIESPAIQDLFVRLITTEHPGQSGVIEWLAEQGLISRLVDFLSPQYPPTLHVIASDLLRGIIGVCAPAPFDPATVVDENAGPGGPNSKNNRLIRDLVSEESISKMTGFMLDDIELSDMNWKGLNGEGAEPSPADPFVVHPLPSISSATSSLSHVCMILVELIRRNNTDYSEPHLFHTLRLRLMKVRDQQVKNHAETGRTSAVDAADKADMETAMMEISPKMGIVHLGRLLTKIIDRFGELHRFLLEPRSHVSRIKAGVATFVEIDLTLLGPGNIPFIAKSTDGRTVQNHRDLRRAIAQL